MLLSRDAAPVRSHEEEEEEEEEEENTVTKVSSSVDRAYARL